MDVTVDRDEMKKEEYEQQFYGYTTRDVITGLKDILVTATEQHTDSLEESLMKHYKQPEQQIAIKKATDYFRSKCTESIAEHMPKLQNIIHEMLSIPRHVLLPEDSVHQQHYTEEDEKQLDTAKEKLIVRARKALCLQTCLQEELQDIQKIIQVEAKLQELKQLHHLRSQVIVEGTEKHCDDMVNAVVEAKNSASRLELLEDQNDVLLNLIEEKFACASV